MSHSAEIFCRGILHCCINLGYRKSLEKREERVSRFSVKNVSLRLPKNSVGKSFTVASFSSSEKVWIRRGGVYPDFPSEILCLTVPKISVEESFFVAILSGSEKVWIGWGRVSSFSVENIKCHTAENFPRGVLYCCIIFGY